MGKNEFLTPKAIANRIKAKGLQKLRWYCQMCQKQCRDENGFKCHCMSDSHRRQMEIFGQNPDRVVDGYSEEFEELFLEHMRRSHRFSRVAATVVYNEYIADRHHVHMNSTKWLTLTEFVKYLGRTGKCKVDETAKGWFITYVDRDSETVFRTRMKEKRVKADLVDEEKKERDILKQIQRAVAFEGTDNAGKTAAFEADGIEDEKMENKAVEKVAFAVGGGGSVREGEKGKGVKVVFEDDEVEGEKAKKRARIGNVGGGGGGGKTALEELILEEEKAKEKANRKDYWVCEGIVVKVMSKGLKEGGYYKMKGVVRKVIDKYVAEIEMIDCKHVVRVDQAELETVIPQIGGSVRVVNGAYRGSRARLLGIDTDKFCAKVVIEKGVYDGRVIPAIDYEDICKIAQ
ncbi:hypothetical protein vseg_002381 [Gypsophila vaccaria]